MDGLRKTSENWSFGARGNYAGSARLGHCRDPDLSILSICRDHCRAKVPAINKQLNKQGVKYT